MPKPCDTHTNLPCVYFGKCYGYVTWGGKSGKPKPLHEVDVCPYEKQANTVVDKSGGMK